ncbi:Isoflavone reductase-like protein [Rhynchospora pubera]|uniref:Isoflavone reductase-like protein n=1 Tax=Rhynchospora pubera TaxID=906938 RepID=A0AAV8DQJ1_9POAL|nr:Isoflavone reductase-like protein [Rhynchospora pubera]
MASEKSKILIIGGTGYIGKFLVTASVRLGHPTYALVRDTSPSDTAKAQTLQNFKDSGVILLQGDIYDHESLVKAIKTVDIVVSAVGYFQVADQTKIIAAVKEAGNVKRFIPSDFGNDVDHAHIEEPAKTAFDIKINIRRMIEQEGIPYTFVSCNFFAGWSLPNLSQYGPTGMPTDKVLILGDGNTKVVYMDEDDIGTYTIKAADDPRALNKVLHMRPHGNTLSHNELVSLWENKVGKTFERAYLYEDEVLKKLKESPNPILAILHSAFIKGDHTNFEIDPVIGVEATELYPDIKYTTMDEYLNRFL